METTHAMVIGSGRDLDRKIEEALNRGLGVTGYRQYDGLREICEGVEIARWRGAGDVHTDLVAADAVYDREVVLTIIEAGDLPDVFVAALERWSLSRRPRHLIQAIAIARETSCYDRYRLDEAITGIILGLPWGAYGCFFKCDYALYPGASERVISLMLNKIPLVVDRQSRSGAHSIEHFDEEARQVHLAHSVILRASRRAGCAEYETDLQACSDDLIGQEIMSPRSFGAWSYIVGNEGGVFRCRDRLVSARGALKRAWGDDALPVGQWDVW